MSKLLERNKPTFSPTLNRLKRLLERKQPDGSWSGQGLFGESLADQIAYVLASEKVEPIRTVKHTAEECGIIAPSKPMPPRGVLLIGDPSPEWVERVTGNRKSVLLNDYSEKSMAVMASNTGCKALWVVLGPEKLSFAPEPIMAEAIHEYGLTVVVVKAGWVYDELPKAGDMRLKDGHPTGVYEPLKGTWKKLPTSFESYEFVERRWTSSERNMKGKTIVIDPIEDAPARFGHMSVFSPKELIDLGFTNLTWEVTGTTDDGDEYMLVDLPANKATVGQMRLDYLDHLWEKGILHGDYKQIIREMRRRHSDQQKRFVTNLRECKGGVGYPDVDDPKYGLPSDSAGYWPSYGVYVLTGCSGVPTKWHNQPEQWFTPRGPDGRRVPGKKAKEGSKNIKALIELDYEDFDDSPPESWALGRSYAFDQLKGGGSIRKLTGSSSRKMEEMFSGGQLHGTLCDTEVYEDLNPWGWTLTVRERIIGQEVLTDLRTWGSVEAFDVIAAREVAAKGEAATSRWKVSSWFRHLYGAVQKAKKHKVAGKKTKLREGQACLDEAFTLAVQRGKSGLLSRPDEGMRPSTQNTRSSRMLKTDQEIAVSLAYRLAYVQLDKIGSGHCKEKATWETNEEEVKVPAQWIYDGIDRLVEAQRGGNAWYEALHVYDALGRIEKQCREWREDNDKPLDFAKIEQELTEVRLKITAPVRANASAFMTTLIEARDKAVSALADAKRRNVDREATLAARSSSLGESVRRKLKTFYGPNRKEEPSRKSIGWNDFTPTPGFKALEIVRLRTFTDTVEAAFANWGTDTEVPIKGLGRWASCSLPK